MAEALRRFGDQFAHNLVASKDRKPVGAHLQDPVTHGFQEVHSLQFCDRIHPGKWQISGEPLDDVELANIPIRSCGVSQDASHRRSVGCPHILELPSARSEIVPFRAGTEKLDHERLRLHRDEPVDPKALEQSA